MDGFVADQGAGIGFEGTDPLFGVLVVIPAVAVRADVASGGGGEGGDGGQVFFNVFSCLPVFFAFLCAGDSGVDALFGHCPVFSGDCSCLLEVEVA